MRFLVPGLSMFRLWELTVVHALSPKMRILTTSSSSPTPSSSTPNPTPAAPGPSPTSPPSSSTTISADPTTSSKANYAPTPYSSSATCSTAAASGRRQTATSTKRAGPGLTRRTRKSTPRCGRRSTGMTTGWRNISGLATSFLSPTTKREATMGRERRGGNLWRACRGTMIWDSVQ